MRLTPPAAPALPSLPFSDDPVHPQPGTPQQGYKAPPASAGAGAAGGAALGAMTGPAAPVAVPLGALAGGAYGYWAANKAIEGGRNAAGVDPRAPVDQLAAPPAAPIVGGGNGQRMTTAQDPRAITPTMAAPVAPSAPVAPVANQGAALPLNQPNGEVTRVGNSYRATQSSDQFQSAATARKASAPTCISRSRWPARYGPSRRHSVDRLAARSGHSFIALSDDFSDLTKVRNCHRRSSAVLQSIGCYYGLTLGGPWPG
jgi:hypothetical protein